VGAAVVQQFADGDGEHSPSSVALTLVFGATLLVGRTRPLLGICIAVAVLVVAPGDEHFPPTVLVPLVPIVLCYCAGAHAPARWGFVSVVVLALASQLHVGFDDAPNLEIGIVTLTPWWCGSQVRRRRELVRELASRTLELEGEEEAFVRLSVQRERARIARDLHDIVSHHLAVMVIQAGAGRLAEPWNADAAAERSATIRDAGGQALTEADRLVAMLQTERATAPHLTELLVHARAAGARVVVTPPDLTLEPEIEAIAYRVTQEALTNAMKHAPEAALDVDVSLSARELTITVHNGLVADQSTIADTGSGLGLTGMRERLMALGGSLDAGPDTDGGFRLCARLPVDPAPSDAPHLARARPDGGPA
jgi:signal transduction histidine kinase